MRRFDKKAMAAVNKANQLAEQRHIASRSLISESYNENLVNEIGTKMAAKAFPALGNSRPQDSREQRIIDDAAKSLFKGYINNPEANFMMTTERGGAPSKYILKQVALHQGNEVLFEFFKEGERENSHYSGDNRLVFFYDWKKDFLSTEGLNELNPFTANFLVGAVNKVREIYFTHMKGDIPMVSKLDKEMGDYRNIPDPNFDVKSKIKKQSFRMFESETPPPLPPPLPGKDLPPPLPPPLPKR